MKIILLIISFVCPVLAHSQKVPSSCAAHDSIKARYTEDADRLALLKIYRRQLNFRDSIEISQKHSDTVLRALIAVYNATSLTARDTVVSVFSIHTFREPVMDLISVAADSSLTWMKQLRKGNTNTGNSNIDKLISDYNLKLSSYKDWSRFFSWHQVIFRSDSNYNLIPLAKKFEANTGVEFSEIPGIAGDGDRITDSIYKDHIELIYSYGWGDCQAGCINRRYWRFNVYFDCSVEYLGSYGSSLPPAVSVSDFQMPAANIYPSPFSDKLNIQFETSNAAIIEMYNAMGRRVLVETVFNNSSVNTTHLPLGLYCYQLKVFGKTISTGKLMKID